MASSLPPEWLESQSIAFLVTTLPGLIEDHLVSQFNLQVMAISYSLTGDKKAIPFSKKPKNPGSPFNIESAENFMDKLQKLRG
jgi:hypothetical protein